MEVQYWIGIDLSQRVGTLALFRYDSLPELIEERELGQPFQHSEKFIEVLDSLLKNNGLSLSALSRFITTSGPGSFTGLRVAYSSLKAFSIVQQTPIDFLWAPEVRALAYWMEHRYLSEIRVLSRLSHSQWGLSQFSILNEKLTLQQEKTMSSFPLDSESLLHDDTDCKEGLFFPIRAKQLGIARMHAQIIQEAKTVSEVIQSEPIYFGSIRFKQETLSL